MDENNEWSPIERQIATALKVLERQRTPDCLEPDELFELIDQGETDPASAPMMAHVTTCAYCRWEYVQLRKDLLEADELRAARTVGESSPAPLVAVSDSTSSAAPMAVRPESTQPPEAMTAPPVTKPSEPTWWEKWRSRLFPNPALGYALALAAALLLAYLAVVRPTQLAERGLRSQNRALLTQNQELAKRLQQTSPITGSSERESRLKAQLQADKAQLALARREKLKAAQDNRTLEQARQKAQQQAQHLATALDQARQQIQLARNNARRGLWTAQEIAALGPSTPLKTNRTMSGNTSVASIQLLSPVETVVLEDRPVLSWKPVEGVTDYKVTVALNFKPILSNIPVSGTTYQVPKSLPRGKTYQWEVEAQKDGASIHTNSWFVVMEQAKADRLIRMRDTLRRQQIDLDLAAGLLETAQRELQAIDASDPLYAEAQKRLKALGERSP